MFAESLMKKWACLLVDTYFSACLINLIMSIQKVACLDVLNMQNIPCFQKLAMMNNMLFY